MNETDALVNTLQAMVETALGGVNTTLPGVVVSYDAARNRAVVRPALPKQLADGRALAAPEVVEVPVLWPAMGGASFTMPVRPGDGVLLHFSQRSLDGWLSGDAGPPDDPRMFDLSDAVASPGLAASRPAVPADDAVWSFGAASITLTASGEVILKGVRIVHDAALTEAPAGDFKAGDVRLGTHRHTGVQVGGSLSGGPVA